MAEAALLVGVTILPVLETSKKNDLQLSERLNPSREKIGELIYQEFEPPKDDGEPGPTAGGGTRNEQRSPQTENIPLKHLLKINRQRSTEFILQT